MGPPGPKGEKVHLIYVIHDVVYLHLYIEYLCSKIDPSTTLGLPNQLKVALNIALIPYCLYQT